MLQHTDKAKCQGQHDSSLLLLSVGFWHVPHSSIVGWKSSTCNVVWWMLYLSFNMCEACVRTCWLLAPGSVCVCVCGGGGGGGGEGGKEVQRCG